MHDDVYQMYLEEIGILTPCTPEEEAVLLERVKPVSYTHLTLPTTERV